MPYETYMSSKAERRLRAETAEQQTARELAARPQNACALYIQGHSEIEAAGYIVAEGSWMRDDRVCVFSVAVVPNGFCHPEAEFIATILDGKCVIQRSGQLREPLVAAMEAQGVTKLFC